MSSTSTQVQEIPTPDQLARLAAVREEYDDLLKKYNSLKEQVDKTIEEQIFRIDRENDDLLYNIHQLQNIAAENKAIEEMYSKNRAKRAA